MHALHITSLQISSIGQNEIAVFSWNRDHSVNFNTSRLSQFEFKQVSLMELYQIIYKKESMDIVDIAMWI